MGKTDDTGSGVRCWPSADPQDIIDAIHQANMVDLHLDALVAYIQRLESDKAELLDELIAQAKTNDRVLARVRAVWEPTAEDLDDAVRRLEDRLQKAEQR